MFTRTVTFTGAKDIDAGIAFLQEAVIPVLEQQHGFRGAIASVDRVGGVFGVLSLWDTAEARDASEGALTKVRQEGGERIGGTVEVATFEEMVVAVGSQPPSPGARLIVTAIEMDPATIDDNVAFFKNTIAPQITSEPGFRGLRNMINRQTGRGVVGTVWADERALRAAHEGALARREQGVARGVTFAGDSFREIVLTDLR
jgi:heme-degrading monooxygenase HmoA